MEKEKNQESQVDWWGLFILLTSNKVGTPFMYVAYSCVLKNIKKSSLTKFYVWIKKVFLWREIRSSVSFYGISQLFSTEFFT